MKVVIIGAGNLATSISLELIKHDYNIIQIYSRTTESARILASQIDTDYTNSLNEIKSNADLYIFSVKDDAVEELASKLKVNDGLWLHTAGSLPLSVLSSYHNRSGVLYPLQSFTKGKQLDWSTTPIFIEIYQAKDLSILKNIAQSLSSQVYILSSDKRKYVHLTGVFANNFSNHMFAIAEQLLEKADLPFQVALPIIEETYKKLQHMSPLQAQTGPAIRNDKNVMDAHIEILEDYELKQIYKSISKNIFKTNNKEMSSINYDLKKIKAIIFDVDGVLSPNAVPIDNDGTPIRITNVKDGFAINLASKYGYGLAIITGGDSQAVKRRYEKIGIKDIYLQSRQKVNDYNDYIKKTGYKADEVVYMGDDLPDVDVMRLVGLAVAPADAAPEVKAVANYISHKNGGDGVARDVLEQIMKAQGKWKGNEGFG